MFTSWKNESFRFPRVSSKTMRKKVRHGALLFGHYLCCFLVFMQALPAVDQERGMAGCCKNEFRTAIESVRVTLPLKHEQANEPRLSIECAICLENIDVMKDIFWCSPSNQLHAFHRECVHKIVPNEDQEVLCPLCRQCMIQLPQKVPNLRDQAVRSLRNIEWDIQRMLGVIDNTHLEPQTCLNTLLPLWNQLLSDLDEYARRIIVEIPYSLSAGRYFTQLWLAGPIAQINKCVLMYASFWERQLRAAQDLFVRYDNATAVFQQGKRLVLNKLNEWDITWSRRSTTPEMPSAIWLRAQKRSQRVFGNYVNAWLRTLYQLLHHTLTVKSNQPFARTYQMLRRTMQHVVNTFSISTPTNTLQAMPVQESCATLRTIQTFLQHRGDELLSISSVYPRLLRIKTEHEIQRLLDFASKVCNLLS